MRIYPISTYRPSIAFKGRDKTADAPIHKEAQRTSEPNLVSYMPIMSNKMKLSENIKFFLNGIDNIDTDNKRAGMPIKIADIGCCDGALCRTLREYLPSNTKYFGLDLSEDMLISAKAKDKVSKYQSTYTLGNAFDLPYKDNKMDAILLSSVMHEIYSYANEDCNEPSYSKDSIFHFMQQAYDSLKSGGVLIIKDPATAASNKNEEIVISNANKTDGVYQPIEDEEELKKADITKLCTYDKLKRFCMDFYPAHNKTYFNENDECVMPRWLVTEFVRHRKWLATPENWDYEIKERYGTMSPDEIADFANKIGFEVIKAENISIPDENNIYAIKDGEFTLKDKKGKTLSLEEFPMFLEVVLRKPREFEL